MQLHTIGNASRRHHLTCISTFPFNLVPFAGPRHQIVIAPTSKHSAPENELGRVDDYSKNVKMRLKD